MFFTFGDLPRRVRYLRDLRTLFSLFIFPSGLARDLQILLNSFHLRNAVYDESQILFGPVQPLACAVRIRVPPSERKHVTFTQANFISTVFLN